MPSDFMDDKYIWLKIVKFQVLFDWNVDSYYLLSIRDKTGLNFNTLLRSGSERTFDQA